MNNFPFLNKKETNFGKYIYYKFLRKGFGKPVPDCNELLSIILLNNFIGYLSYLFISINIKQSKCDLHDIFYVTKFSNYTIAKPVNFANPHNLVSSFTGVIHRRLSL